MAVAKTNSRVTITIPTDLRDKVVAIEARDRGLYVSQILSEIIEEHYKRTNQYPIIRKSAVLAEPDCQ